MAQQASQQAVTTCREFQELAELRLLEAKTLFANQHWDGAYYLLGYVVECAIKAVIAKLVVQTESMLTKSQSDTYYSHNIENLIRLANLNGEISVAPQRATAWLVTIKWNEQYRYRTSRTQLETESMLNAIEQEILPWLKTHW